MANRTLTSMRSEVYRRLAESGAGFFQNDEIDQWLADGQRDVSVTVEPLLTTATVTTTAETFEYALPTDVLSIRQVHYKQGTVWTMLEETTWEALFESDPNFENADIDDDSIPIAWYWRSQILGVYPAPGATYAGANTLRILYTYTPSPMSGASDTSGLPDWLDDTIILFAVYRGLLKDREYQKAQATAQEYSRGVAEATLKLQRQRRQHAPRLIPTQRGGRTYWSGIGRRGDIVIISGSTA